ncbi:MAG: putative peptidoglycan glycosyltransferase FtsW [Patescibacteria group bacterium]|nr:putative peptidoglycan glycosyltransferase FtsW [Patescibacteria group bacterium]
MTRLSLKKVDPILFTIIVGLLIFGVLMVYDASVVYAHDVFGGRYHFLLRQLFWVVLGVIAALLSFFSSEKTLRKISIFIFGFSMVSLVFLAIPKLFSFPLYDKFAPEVNGARRWVILNPPDVIPPVPLLSRISFQPAELAKLSLILYYANWFSSLSSPRRRRSSLLTESTELPGLLTVLALLGLVCFLVLLQPDFATTAMIAVIGLWVYFVAGAPLLLLLLSGLAVAFVGVIFIFISPYRRQRLLTFLDPHKADPLSAGYHLRQVLIALGSGGVFGVGLGESRQKYGYLPEAAADSIFAIIGEELGFVGTSIVILAFALFLWRAFYVVRETKNLFYKLVAGGVTGWIGVQVLVNLGAMTGLIPLTGITLPLVSYGGSSMIFLMAGVGVLLRASTDMK